MRTRHQLQGSSVYCWVQVHPLKTLFYRYLCLEFFCDTLTDETVRRINGVGVGVGVGGDPKCFQEVELHLVRCFYDEVTKMIEAKVVDGLEVDDVDLDKVWTFAKEVTAILVNQGT